ncbi:hypothetical protein [Alteromonas portus]|uniref:hypothetical protein n=1 Tax=Alteromonas portus TaxID=2565549 RepID=UPI003BF7F4BE
MKYPYKFHIALDGNGLNGLEGRAGVCLFQYDPVTKEHTYSVKFYDGMSGGHAVSISPDYKIGYLGSTSQQLMFYNTTSLEEIGRVSTLRFESVDTSIKGSTHLVWLNNSECIASLGEGFWKINVNNLGKPERLGDHLVKTPHSIKQTVSKRYLVYGSMDHPSRGEACEVGIFDLSSGIAKRVSLPTTCWHVICDDKEDKFYALSFRVNPQEKDNWQDWSIAHMKEYVYEIDAATGEVIRHWSASQDTPAHINSDVCLSDKELIYCNGASATIVMIDRRNFSSYRILDTKPNLLQRFRSHRQRVRTIIDSLSRGSLFDYGHHHLRAFRVSRGSIMDSVYACQLSADQSLLFTANRGTNSVTIYSYPECKQIKTFAMPSLQKFDKSLSWWEDPRLGFHHSKLISPIE